MRKWRREGEVPRQKWVEGNPNFAENWRGIKTSRAKYQNFGLRKATKGGGLVAENREGREAGMADKGIDQSCQGNPGHGAGGVERRRKRESLG